MTYLHKIMLGSLYTACVIVVTLMLSKVLFPPIQPQRFVMLDTTKLMAKLSDSVGRDADKFDVVVGRFAGRIDEIIAEYLQGDIIVLNAEFVLSGMPDVTDVFYEAAK